MRLEYVPNSMGSQVHNHLINNFRMNMEYTEKEN